MEAARDGMTDGSVGDSANTTLPTLVAAPNRSRPLRLRRQTIECGSSTAVKSIGAGANAMRRATRLVATLATAFAFHDVIIAMLPRKRPFRVARSSS